MSFVFFLVYIRMYKCRLSVKSIAKDKFLNQKTVYLIQIFVSPSPSFEVKGKNHEGRLLNHRTSGLPSLYLRSVITQTCFT